MRSNLCQPLSWERWKEGTEKDCPRPVLGQTPKFESELGGLCQVEAALTWKPIGIPSEL